MSYAKQEANDIARAKENLFRDFPVTLEGKVIYTHVSFELKYTKEEFKFKKCVINHWMEQRI